MKRKRSFIAILVVLALLIGVYVYLSNRPDTPDVVDKEPAIEISKVDREKIVKLSIDNGNLDEALVFEKKTRTVESDDKDKEPKTESYWVNTTPYPVKLVQSKVDELSRSFSSLNAEIVVEEDPKDLSRYGLDKPIATGTAILDDNTKVTIYLGNKTAEGATWYLMKEGDPKVYTVYNQHGQRLNYVLSDFRDKTLPTVDATKMTYLNISGQDRREIEIKLSDDITDEQATYGIGLYFMTKPFKRVRGVDSEKLAQRLEKLSGLNIKDFVDDHPTDLGKYGLDQPKLNFLIKDSDENELELSFGNKLDDGTIYFKTSDSDAVYLMDQSRMEFMEFEPMLVTDKFALLMNIQDVDGATIEGRGRKNVLSITRTTVESEDEDEEDEVIETYFLDGEEVEEKPFKSFYQSLIGIVVDMEKAHTAQGSPDLKITYHKVEGGEATVEVYPHDRDFYSLVVNGDMESEFLIYRNRLDWVFKDLDKLIAGDTED
jgi:hypothetical protein